MRAKFLVMSAFALTAIHVDVMAAVGRTPGSFDVTAWGEGTYTIPIAVPPGVNGLTPQLALTYASRSRQSIAGYGWNISGAMAITRCNSTFVQDGVARQVRNDLQDRFCLNGSKLRLVSAAGTYGAVGSEYRTEIETFSRITAMGPAAGNGPGWFKVEGKDGLVYEFGATADSRIESKGQTTPRSWALNKVKDQDDNEIKYTYAEDTLGAYRLASITYGGNSGTGGTLPIYTVSLMYEARPTAEVESSYKADANVKETNRLDRIDVKYGTTLYRSYDLTYEASLSVAKHSRLASVRECAGATPDCLSATTFLYEDSPGLGAEVNTGNVVSGTSPLPLDVNGDGKEDLVYPSATNFWMVMFANGTGYDPAINTGVPSTGASGAIPFDYDANGQYDLLVPYSGGTWWVLYGSSSGLAAPQNTGAAATGTGASARALDIDGDGQDDLVWADRNPTPYAGGDVIRWRRKIPGGAFSATVTDLITPLPVDQAIPSGVFSGWAQKMPRRVPDFNGDGRDDLAFRKNIRRDITSLAGQKSSTTEATTAVVWSYSFKLVVVCPGVTDCLTSAAGVASEPYFGDFNGDGQSDLLYYDDDGTWKYRYATGTTFTSPGSMGTLSTYGDALILDWDVDGYDDLLMLHIATNEWHVIRSTGEVFASPVATGISGVGMTSPVVADLNGDGIRELAYRGSSNTHARSRSTTRMNSFQRPTPSASRSHSHTRRPPIPWFTSGVLGAAQSFRQKT
jgi:hypothetical protein